MTEGLSYGGRETWVPKWYQEEAGESGEGCSVDGTPPALENSGERALMLVRRHKYFV